MFCVRKIEMMSDVQSDTVIYFCKSLFRSFCLEQYIFYPTGVSASLDQQKC